MEKLEERYRYSFWQTFISSQLEKKKVTKTKDFTYQLLVCSGLAAFVMFIIHFLIWQALMSHR